MLEVLRLGMRQSLSFSTKDQWTALENPKDTTSVISRIKWRIIGSEQMITLYQFLSISLMYHNMDMLFCLKEFKFLMSFIVVLFNIDEILSFNLLLLRKLFHIFKSIRICLMFPIMLLIKWCIHQFTLNYKICVSASMFFKIWMIFF